MAKKKKNSGYTTAKTVKKGVVAAWLSAAAFVLVAAVVVGVLGYGTQGFKDWGFSRFAPKGKVEVVQPVQEEQPNGGMVLSDSVSDCGAVFASYSVEREEFAAYSLGDNIESSYVLYAKVLPEEATFDTVEYSADWVNPDSEWAQGKVVTDYVDVSQGTGGNHNAATVSCKKEFCEPVAITAASSYDNTIKATVQADYVGRVLCSFDGLPYPETIDDGIRATYEGYTGTIAPNLEDCIAYCYVPAFISYSVIYEPFKIYDGATGMSYDYNKTTAETALHKLGISTTWDFEDYDTEDQYVKALSYSGTISFDGCEIGDEVETPSLMEMMYAAVKCPTELRAQMRRIVSKFFVPDASYAEETGIVVAAVTYGTRKAYGSHVFESSYYDRVLAGDRSLNSSDFEDCSVGTTDGLIVYADGIQIEQPGADDSLIFG